MSNHIDAQTPLDSATIIIDTTALGAVGLALSCLCVGLKMAFPSVISVPTVGLGLVAGGIAQLLAGLTAWARGREMASIAFCANGLFFLSLLSVFVFPELGLGMTPDRIALSSYLFMWALFFGIINPGLRQHCPAFTLPTAIALQCAALILFALALLTGHIALKNVCGLVFLGNGLVTTLAILTAILRHGSACPR